MSCSKGTYIRSLCEDIAEKLETVGYMKELQRTKVGTFLIEDAITVEEFEKRLKNNDVSNIISIEQIFKTNGSLELENKTLNKYLNGVQIEQNSADGIYRIYVKNKFIGLGLVKDKKLKRDLVID